jgi:3-phenylpropionate/trans-cinnamate dioxygenase ferredoxin subunit
MNRWIEVESVEKFVPDTHREVDIEGVSVAVFNLEGAYFAIRDMCTHDGGKLADGEMQGETIVCPRHGARFSIKTGKVLSPPAYEDVRIYKVRVVDGKVQVNSETLN